MLSSLPKPLHRLCGRPMVLHVLDTLAELGCDHVVVVVGFAGVEVTKAIEAEAPEGLEIRFVEQHDQLGTGDATAVGLTGFDREIDLEEGDLLVLPGDAPLIRAATLRRLVKERREQNVAVAILSAVVSDPTGYGRIVRGKNGRVTAIVEQADASELERQIDEVNTSIYCFDQTLLAPGLRRISPTNAQGEYYLTDVIGVLGEAGYAIGSFIVEDATEIAGVNDRAQLAVVQSTLRRRINRSWMQAGVTISDPSSISLDASVRLGREVTLLPGVVLEGATVIGNGSTIGPNCHLVDTIVGECTTLRFVEAKRAQIGANAEVGPFGVLHPGTVIADGEVTGPFFSSTPSF